MAESEIFDDYTYVLVKIAAAKGALIDRQKFLELADSKNLEEFKSKLASMQKDLSSEIIHTSKDLEGSCRSVFFNYIQKIVQNCPFTCQTFVKYFLQKYQIENLKTVLAGKIANIDEMTLKERINFQIETIFHSERLIRDALHVAKFEDVVFLYSRTPYHEILREIQKRYEGTKEIFFIYALLDRYYIRILYKTIEDNRWSQEELDVIKMYSGTLADFYNLSMVLRGINHNFEWNEIEVLLTGPNETYKIKHDDLKVIHRIGKDSTKIADELKNLGKRYSGGGAFVFSIDPAHVINSLKKFYFHIQLSFLKKRMLNEGYEFAQIIAFILRKEAEIDNIITILEGIKTETDRETIKEYLLI
ncbi:MAG TPA: V-type ATPase subunit [Candidatus Lokiarchaeia archaeon]|nr:V-type ATPase subunit [Candidatus Lokiarchaeia archaeon]